MFSFFMCNNEYLLIQGVYWGNSEGVENSAKYSEIFIWARYKKADILNNFTKEFSVIPQCTQFYLLS